MAKMKMINEWVMRDFDDMIRVHLFCLHKAYELAHLGFFLANKTEKLKD